MQTKASFSGTGGELFKKMIGGALLTGITLGIYAPWFLVGMWRYVASKTTLHGTERGRVQLEFTGQGGELFVTVLVNALLTSITLGIYAPWALVKVAKFYTGNLQAKARDGTTFDLTFDATGGQLFGNIIVGSLLMGITLGIYAPWYMAKLAKLLLNATSIRVNGQVNGSLDFHGKGGELFGVYFVGMLLTGVTLGIYLPWFQVKVMAYMAQNTTAVVEGTTFCMGFTGTGGELLKRMVIDGLLTGVTFGIYGFWALANQLRFELDNVVASRTAPMAMPAPARQPLRVAA